MIMLENKEYDLYGVVKDLNHSSTDTYALILELKDKDRVVVRVNNDIVVENGRIYHIIGVGKPYKNKIHIYANNIELLDNMNIKKEEKEKIVNDLMGYYKVEYKVCLNHITNVINNLENEIIKKIVSAIFEKYKNEFMTYPAATKFHHAYEHGLIYHTYNTLRLGEAYTSIYSHLNSDLIYSGIILHDLMKVKEISSLAYEYTISGKLIGHISLINEEVVKTASKLGYEDTEEALLLSHIVLSHHDEGEFGSPKRPQIIEALIVHLCDLADAKIEPTIEALEVTKEGEFTEQIPVNNRDKFFKHKLSK